MNLFENSPGHWPRECQSPGTVPSPCSLFPSGTGLQSWSPEDTIYGVLGGGPGLRDLPGQTPYTYPWNVQKFIKKLINFLADFRANVAPTWLPKLTPDGYKIDAKIYHFFRCLLNSCFFCFWWILGGEMEPNWDQDGMKNRFFRKREKTHLELAR